MSNIERDDTFLRTPVNKNIQQTNKWLNEGRDEGTTKFWFNFESAVVWFRSLPLSGRLGSIPLGDMLDIYHRS